MAASTIRHSIFGASRNAKRIRCLSITPRSCVKRAVILSLRAQHQDAVTGFKPANADRESNLALLRRERDGKSVREMLAELLQVWRQLICWQRSCNKHDETYRSST